MNLPFFIAKRYLVSKKSHNAINIISGIALGGIAIGTAALIIILSAFNGISDLVKSLYNSFDSEIEITSNWGKTFIPSGTAFDSLKNIKGITGITGLMEDKALLRFKNTQCVAYIKGVEDNYAEITGFDTLVKDGVYRLQTGSTDYGIFGRGVADLLDINALNKENEGIDCYSPRRGLLQHSFNPADEVIHEKLYYTGMFSINEDFDRRYVITSIDFARKLFDYSDNSITALDLKLDKHYDSQKLKSKIKTVLGAGFRVRDKYEQNELLYKTLKTEKLATYIILVFILIIATFSIVGSLSMLILDKEKDIKILWNMGANMTILKRVFLFEGLLITFIGAAGGLIIGTLVCELQIRLKLISMGQGFVVNVFPVSIQWQDYFFVLLTVLSVGILSSWFPVSAFTTKGIRTE
jgi:lipoprotein-releasing system permease protein